PHASATVGLALTRREVTSRDAAPTPTLPRLPCAARAGLRLRGSSAASARVPPRALLDHPMHRAHTKQA
ncbi:MAG: hypothetical protein ABWU16_08910, partial [Halothiobacillaceae bacterium]